MRSKESVNLDLFRTMAVLMVFVNHILLFVFRTSTAEQRLNAIGQFGVLIFFVHTTLVLMMSMERSGADPKKFYVRRFFRVYPLTIFTVGLVLLLHLPRNPAVGFTRLRAFDVASNLALTTDLTYSPPVLGPLWSLPLEIQMYLALPFLFLLTRRKGAPKYLGAAWILSLVLALVQPHVSGRLDIAQYIPCFLGGVFAYVLYGKLQPRLHWALWPVFVIATYAAFQLWDKSWHGWIECALLGIGIPLFEEVSAKPIRVLAATVAKYSYGIYLFHLVGIYLCFKVLHAPLLLQFAACILFTAVTSFMSYHLIEAPLIKFGKSLTSDSQDARLKAARAASAA